VTTSSLNCPPWCTAAHPRPDYLDHSADVTEFGTKRLDVLVTVSQHIQPGHVGAEAVNVFASTAQDTELVLLQPELAASIGRVLLELDDHGRRLLAVALADAAALVLTGRGITSADPQSAVEREAGPNTPDREATPNAETTDGR
jgi:hypothetical protein